MSTYMPFPGRLACAAVPTRVSTAGPKTRPPNSATNNAAPLEFLHVACARIRHHGYSAETRRWVQRCRSVKKTARRIYYASDSWDRNNAVVSPGRISRQKFEADTRCRHGYPAGVIPVPSDRHRPGSAGRLFYATRKAAEADLERAGRERTASVAPPIKELRRVMADAHPDHGGTAEQFIEARRRYQTALRRRCAW